MPYFRCIIVQVDGGEGGFKLKDKVDMVRGILHYSHLVEYVCEYIPSITLPLVSSELITWSNFKLTVNFQVYTNG